MDQFVVSARKYRPATFNTVVGQNSITTTLKNAIKNKHLAQAFLFCGPRGVGKTTCARILAKTINCTNITTDTEGCNSCESCVSFNNGQSLNIFELDAASNNSVEDIRNLVDQVRYPPQSGDFKIYIIDEVHMLSTPAFNAFLKTLEEPPSYAIFILATTEKHKIIPTILSRCQIFDFNRITIDDIASHLKWIAESETVEADPEALHLIAQKADGALRDALSIFDQIVSFAGNKITYKHVIDNLNILDYEYYFKVTDHILHHDFSGALLLLDELITDGFDIHHFITGLAGHFRDLLVSRDPQTVSLLEVGAKTKDRYLSQSKQFEIGALLHFLHLANRCDIEFKAAQNQRLHCELALLKMCTFQQLPGDVHEGNNNSGKAPLKKKVAENTSTVKQTAESDASSALLLKNPKPVASLAEEPASTGNQPPAGTGIIQKEESVIAKSPVARVNRASTISISQQLNGDKTDQVTLQDDNSYLQTISHDKSFGESEVMHALQAFIKKINSEGRKQLAAALSKHEPVLINPSHIEFPVDNSIQQNDIQDNKPELLRFFKLELQNKSIEISARIAESEATNQVAYTPAEKYTKMAEKNPGLNVLRQQFDLEIDF